MRPMGNRKYGEIYITGGTENRDIHRAKYFDNKRFMYRRTFLSKPEADGAADAHRAQGHLARVVQRMVWINHAGWELGMEKVQGYVLYIHYTTDEKKGCPCGSGKSSFTFEGKKRCSDCAPMCVGD